MNQREASSPEVPRIVEHVAQQQEFLVVDLEDGGRLEEFLDKFLGVVVAVAG